MPDDIAYRRDPQDRDLLARIRRTAILDAGDLRALGRVGVAFLLATLVIVWGALMAVLVRAIVLA